MFIILLLALFVQKQPECPNNANQEYNAKSKASPCTTRIWQNLCPSGFSKIISELFRERDPTSTIEALGGCLSDTNLFTIALLSTAPSESLGILGPLELGNCYPFCREGDIIAILYGCSGPIALRPDGNAPGQFKIVGEVYLPSYSNGEALGKFEEREFVLS
jgi:hypothetical protein